MTTTADAIELLNEAEQTTEPETPAIDELLTSYGLDSVDATATEGTADRIDPSEEAGAVGLLEYFAPGGDKGGDAGGDTAEGAGQEPAATGDKQTEPAPVPEKDAADKASTEPEGEGKAKEPDEPTGLDSELTEEETALVQSRPEAERAETERKLKAAKFEDHLRSARPIEEIGQYLSSVSESRAQELSTYFVTQAIANPEQLEGALREVATKQPEAYRDFVVGLMEGNIKQFTAETTETPGVTIDELKTAVRFYEAHKERIDKINDPAAFDFEGTTNRSGEFDPALLADTELTPADLADMEEWVPEIADKVKAVLQRGAQAPPPATEAKPAVADPKSDEPAPDAGLTLEVVEGENNAFLEGYNFLDTHLRQLVLKEAGIAVGANEEKLAPEVADLKRLKGDVLLRGLGDSLPPFERGLLQWIDGRDDKTKAAFAEALRDMGHFTKAREGKNVAAAAQKMVPFAERYMRERYKTPIVQHLDAAIERMAGSPARAADVDQYIPGGAPSVSQTPQPTDADSAFFDLALNYQPPQ
jgi:hypothetical protein